MKTLLDTELIDDLRGLAVSDPAFLKSLLTEFLNYSQKDLAYLRSLQANAEIWKSSGDAIKGTLHNLQGRCANIGLKALALKIRDMASDPLEIQFEQLQSLTEVSVTQWCNYSQLDPQHFKNLFSLSNNLI